MKLFSRAYSLLDSLTKISYRFGQPGLWRGLSLWSAVFFAIAQSRFPASWRRPYQLHLVYKNNAFSIWIMDRTGLAVIEEVFLNEEYHFDEIKTPKIIVDAGANIGITSIYFALTYPNARIYAIEPDTNTFEVLKKNVRAFKNISTHQLALSDVDGTVEFFVQPTSSIASSLLQRGGGQRVDVSSATLETFMAKQNISALDLFKFDVEGAEDRLLAVIKNRKSIHAYIGEIHEDLISVDLATIYSYFYDFTIQTNRISLKRFILKAWI